MTTSAVRRPAPDAPAIDGRDRARTRLAIALRVVASAHVVLVWAQPVLAGGYLGGDYDQLSLHARNADLVSYTGYLLVAIAVALVAVRGRWWPLPGSIALVLAETVQYLAGRAADLALHLPLGVLVVGGSVWLAVASWRDSGLGSRRGPDAATDAAADAGTTR